MAEQSAICEYCGIEISRFDDSGGSWFRWRHMDTGQEECNSTTFAHPIGGTIVSEDLVDRAA